MITHEWQNTSIKYTCLCMHVCMYFMHTCISFQDDLHCTFAKTLMEPMTFPTLTHYNKIHSQLAIKHFSDQELRTVPELVKSAEWFKNQLNGSIEPVVFKIKELFKSQSSTHVNYLVLMVMDTRQAMLAIQF